MKILYTVIAAGLTYLLTQTTHQPQIWQLTMSVFFGGIVLVVQVLVDAAEQARRTADLVRTMNEAATLLSESEGILGRESLTRLVKAAGGINRREDLQLRFADREVEDLTVLFEGLRSGRAEYEGEDRDWLLGLTDTASVSIDATSMTSFNKYRGVVDEGQFWAGDLGQRYLDRQRRAIERNILFDQKISYELHTAKALGEDERPLIASVAPVVNPKHVEQRRRRFEALWAAGDER